MHTVRKATSVAAAINAVTVVGLEQCFTNITQEKKVLRLFIFLLMVMISSDLLAGTVTGKVNMLEIWENGNVVFTLDTAVTACNGQFVLNFSSNGTKNIYSALLAAKMSEKSVRVIYSDTCGLADNYGQLQYNIPIYVYVNDE